MSCLLIPPPQSTLPVVSVIIPMYNAEKYIAECLDSILTQTFQDFEVIIVDDCSTDSSCEIVDSYIPKFDGRLKLYHLPKNSGSGAIARNIGLAHARGEYVYNVDNDDMLTKTALEELYTLAKEYDAEVVYCEKYYTADEDGTNIQVKVAQKGDLTDKPTLETEDLKDRVDGLINDRYWSVPWIKMVRRKFIVDNEFFFPYLNISEDNIWTQGLIFFAKNFLRVPNAVYIYRQSKSLVIRKEKSPAVQINFWLRPVLLGLKSLDDLMSRHEFFKENPDYRYDILEKFLKLRFEWIWKSVKVLYKDEIYKILNDEFGKYFGEYDVLVSALCTNICEQIKTLRENAQEIKRLKDAAQKDKELIAEYEEAFNRLRSENFPPAISVIIPMYNAENFIGECLDSLLIQTHQDFEVIITDDCSTDNSVEIVKSYIPKFGGRLILSHTEENSGGGGYIPRNIGLKLARGEYVIFVDSDDFLLGTALETLYKAAKEYNAEVVYFSIYYDLKNPNDIYIHRDGLGRNLFQNSIEDKITFTVNNRHKILQEHILQGVGEGNFRHPWSKFVRRDFLIKNEILFPSSNIKTGGDNIWCINVYAHAKRFLRLPTPLYFYRSHNDTSITRTIRTPAEQAHYIVSAYVNYLKTIHELQNKVEFLRENPIYCYKIAEAFFNWFIQRFVNESLNKLSNRDIYELLSHKFDGEDDVFKGAAPFFLLPGKEKQKQQLDSQLLRKLRPYITARIDIKMLGVGDFQILSVSDNNANITKPDWLNKSGGVGYVISSYKGNLEIVAKTDVDGEIQLGLMGLDIRDPQDKSRRIPYWIDYTRFTVDGKTIFDTVTPTWHDKPYRYKLNAKADQEIIIQVEWLPHRSDT